MKHISAIEVLYICLIMDLFFKTHAPSKHRWDQFKLLYLLRVTTSKDSKLCFSSTPTLSSSSTPTSPPIRSCFLWAQQGVHTEKKRKKKGGHFKFGHAHNHNNSQHQRTIGISAELRLRTSSLVTLLLFFLTNWAAQPHSKFIKAVSLRITPKANTKESWGKN